MLANFLEKIHPNLENLLHTFNYLSMQIYKTQLYLYYSSKLIILMQFFNFHKR